MRTSFIIAAGTLILVGVGCAGPERKLGRGITNLTEFTRLGELNRSVEQSAVWDGPTTAYTTGFMRGINRSLARTLVGAYEVVTFPIPSYEPHFAPKSRLYPDASIRTYTEPYGGLALSEKPVYPDAYKPGLFSDSIFSTDTSLGFSGGDVAPMIPGSRFRIFED
jgi:putative exosortase-associated protein (TIGR04073 family)